MNIDIAIPSYDRTDRLRTCLASVAAAVDNLESGDSATTRVFLGRQQDMDAIQLQLAPREDVLLCAYTVDFIASDFWNHAFKDVSSSGLFCLVDDQEIDPDALCQVLAALKRSDGDCVIAMNVTNGGGVYCASPILVGRRFMERFPDNAVFCPDYHCLYFDEELHRYASDIHRWVACPESKALHHHPSFTGLRPDATHYRSRRNKTKDVQMHAVRRSQGLVWGASWELLGRQP